ncbi:SMP-30/gluconolactonase/LRE family protein [Sphingobium sufflavum]|uniref:SMP-30/gluconolactonase/LRE family protein n=1 Tax=Sphingobium sufflavum TaxID=1129547 RepID=UPI001F205DA1|nr:SMP-30/gluconolactonase/LRE family protein [Sphingobium sufflavum]MCE7796333.1 SMP-30/gluconolactonase/LRE family protein [Sphingobium sufflavum]
MTTTAAPTPRFVWPTEALLGEGPYWSEGEGALWYVDIKGGAIHRYHPASNAHATWAVGGQPSFVVPAGEGRLVAGSNHSLILFDTAAADGALPQTMLAPIAMPAHNRTNDATVDCHGRLWFGTMDDGETEGTGAIYCLVDGAVRQMGGEAVVTNGPAATRDGRTLYHVDSGSRIIWRSRIGDGPELLEKEVFLQLGEADGYPDGIVLDSEGCLWVALWDGWGVQRHAPDGSLLLRIDLPCARVTKIAFGGDDLRTAYVTTARTGLSEAQLAEQPLAGGLFAFDAPVAGLPLPNVVF